MVFPLKLSSLLSRWKWTALPYLPVGFTLAVGISLSILAALKVKEIERSQQRQEFERQADNLTFLLQRDLDNASRIARSLGGFFASTDGITSGQFTKFSEQLLQDSPGIASIGFAQQVSDAERESFENQLSRQGVVPPFIWERNDLSQIGQSPRKEEYVVTAYIYTVNSNHTLLGYDHSSDWQRQSAIARARDSEIMVTANSVSLAHDSDSSSPDFIIYQPLYSREVQTSSMEELREYFVGVSYIEFTIKDAAIAALNTLNWQNLSFYLYDLDIDRLESALGKDLNNLDSGFLLFYDAETGETIDRSHPLQSSDFPHSHRSNLSCPYSKDRTACLRTLNLQNREWSVLILPNMTPYALSWAVLMTFATSLLATGILALYLSMSIRRSQQSEKLVKALKEARCDALTGLANRREFEQQLQAAISMAIEGGEQDTLCYMDLDRFKIVNDICGHAAGDRLLCQVSEKISHLIRKTDRFARVGGDEFCLLLRHCGLEESQRVARGILDAIATFKFTWEEKEFKIGISLGLVAIASENIQEIDAADILRQADKACYRAKQNGRNCIVISNSEEAETEDPYHGLKWLTWLNEGLADEFLQLYYQPTISLKSQQDRQYIEILLRLRDRPEVPLSLSEFMRDAERYQLMPTIDRWVVQTFLKMLSFFVRQTNIATDWKSNLYAINLSAATLNDGSFIEFCRNQLERYQIPPEVICFEITEHLAIANIEKAQSLILDLKSLGCYFTLDDFGSGMSSFAYLRDLPVDYLKVDGSFILNLTSDDITYNIVDAIARMGEILGIKTIAEFVENDRLLGQLKELGFDYAQGYGVAVPTHLHNHFDSHSLTYPSH